MTDSVVECEKCYRQEDVDFGWCLRHGWPKCHGRTMALVSAPDYPEIDQAVAGIVKDAIDAACKEAKA